MAEYGLVKRSTMEALGDEVRRITGYADMFTPQEMVEVLSEITPGVAPASETMTYLLVDDEGTEVPAVLVEEATVFTATANDIRLGTVAATDEGVTEGTKQIPAYHTTEGVVGVPAGGDLTIYLPEGDRYNYTKLQAIICPFNSSLAASVAAEKVSVNNSVYNAGSVEVIATVTLDNEAKKINFGIKNEGTIPCVIRYFTYKEEN